MLLKEDRKEGRKRGREERWIQQVDMFSVAVSANAFIIEICFIGLGGSNLPWKNKNLFQSLSKINV